MRNNPPPQYSPSQGPIKGRLPCPVIIPQRRPRDKKRGFVRAYAPVLESCGIDQKTFLDLPCLDPGGQMAPCCQCCCYGRRLCRNVCAESFYDADPDRYPSWRGSLHGGAA
jgi:hypothetical protein